MAETAGDAVPVAQRGSWTSFLKSITSFSGDLSSMTAPPFILSPTSLTEFPAYWCERPHLFAAIASATPGQARALAVLRWFISSLKDHYTSRNEKLGSEKKPLNPVLGELFYGLWPAKPVTRGETMLLVEQVSHHPPITAYVLENRAKGLRLVGHSAQKTSFSSGSISVRQIGHAILTICPPPATGASETTPEQYLITLPRLRIDGLWYGSPYIELCESSTIVGEGFVAQIDYKGKGYFGGLPHMFKATMTPAPGQGQGSAGDDVVVEGTWDKTSKYTRGPYQGSFHDVLAAKEEVHAVGGDSSAEGGEPVMGPMETRKLWAAVAQGIREGDFESASKAKAKIENEMRQRRKDEAAAGTKWPLKHFTHTDSDPIYEVLGKLGKISPTTEDTYVFCGNWPALLAAAPSPV